MERIHAIFNQKGYWEHVEKIQHLEKNREYCRHDMHHFLDVARIGYLYTLENHLPYHKATLYAIGLLHDIGKWMQYEQGIPHEKASADLAPGILLAAGFSQREIEEICTAIINHRKYNQEDYSLSFVAWFADKKSRQCFCCAMEKSCNWSNDKKNLTVWL